MSSLSKLFLIALLGFSSACNQANSKTTTLASDQRLLIAGSSTILPIIDEIVPLFEKKHPNTRIEVQGGGSSVGIKNPREGKADIGMVSRALKPEESDLFATTIGEDGIVLFVHKDNPIQNLRKEEVVRLYKREISNWSEFGGNNAPITLISKEQGRATLELFESYFDLKGKIFSRALIIGPNGQAIKTVEANPNAVAYVSVGSALKAIELGSSIRILSLDGVMATAETVRNGSYPLARSLSLTTKTNPTGLRKEFLDFVLSKEGQKILLSQDFVPVIE